MTRARFRTALVLVLLGGALGGLARHAVDLLVGRTLFPVSTFPVSTFAVNVLGCAVLAAIPAVVGGPRSALFLGPGVLGGFTTLSAFSEQTRALVAGGHGTLAASYVVGSVGISLLAVLGVRRMTTPTGRDRFVDEEGER